MDCPIWCLRLAARAWCLHVPWSARRIRRHRYAALGMGPVPAGAFYGKVMMVLGECHCAGQHHGDVVDDAEHCLANAGLDSSVVAEFDYPATGPHLADKDRLSLRLRSGRSLQISINNESEFAKTLACAMASVTLGNDARRLKTC